MAINLLKMLKDQLGDGVMKQAAGLIGEDTSATKSAISAILPTLLGSVVSKGANKSGASRLLSMISDGNYDGSMFNNLSGLLGGGAASDGLMNKGKDLVSSLLGDKQSSVLDLITRTTGLNKSSNSGLMSMLAPMVMGMIGKQVTSKGMDASGLMNLLSGQKEHLAGQLPAGLGDMLGFAKTTTTATTTASKAATATRATPTPEPASSGGGGGFLKWALGIAALALLGYFGYQAGVADKASSTISDTAGELTTTAGNTASNAADAAGNAVNSAGDAVKSMADKTVDASGNLVDEAGNIAAKAGEYTKDAAGNMVDASGNMIDKASETATNMGEDASAAAGAVADAAGDMADGATFTVDEAGNLVDADGKIAFNKGDFTVAEDGSYVDKKGNVIGRALKSVGKAIGSAAGATGSFFKNSFNKMFKKEAGAETVYDLSDITWNPDNNRITDFSKDEVEGLANALKENPDTKIVVQGFTADGKNNIANKALSKSRAKVVQDMLVAFGVDAGQISSKGMGSKDDVGNKIQIVVE